jgi:hypothetical protein
MRVIILGVVVAAAAVPASTPSFGQGFSVGGTITGTCASGDFIYSNSGVIGCIPPTAGNITFTPPGQLPESLQARGLFQTFAGDYGASGSNMTQTGSITGATATLTLGGIADFANGEGVLIPGAGHLFGNATASPAASVVGATGSDGDVTTAVARNFDESGIAGSGMVVSNVAGNASSPQFIQFTDFGAEYMTGRGVDLEVGLNIGFGGDFAAGAGVTGGMIVDASAGGGALALKGGASVGVTANPFVQITGAYTVASGASQLPTCASALAGAIAYVTDASSPSYNATLTGGSSTKTLAMCNGSTWTAH